MTTLLNIFNNKTILVTGHTGFKGSWLTSWLLKLGANVIGYSDSIPTTPSLFLDANLESKIQHIAGDVRDLDLLNSVISGMCPDFVFHLAAQAIVSTSYEDPVLTMSTNFIGTVNIMDCLRKAKHPCIAIIVTSDKCYENIEQIWGYKETDQIGGKDIYSASKGAAEIAFHGYYESFFKNNVNSELSVASGRAGNVIGGGDWAKDRIVVDCIKSWINSEPVKIRSPDATRPWQHVLEPISDYLTLAACLFNNKKLNGESFNFGPNSEKSRTVVDVIDNLYDCIEGVVSVSPPYEVVDRIPFHEAGLLKLNCDKSLYELGWSATLQYEECIQFIGEWYCSYIKDKNIAYELTMQQIARYEELGNNRGAVWALQT